MAGPSGPDAVTSSRGDLDKQFNMKQKGYVDQFGVMRCEFQAGRLCMLAGFICPDESTALGPISDPQFSLVLERFRL